ncbi:hypothetical protein AW27_023165 [Streptomyces sp. PCS3-D2]|uniref:hypothetical protein n=1 Tax=Streptomyces sp. PCS3-D2 TaxID=1460244 RepID=UPI0004493274|nr:hypothetical protein [Streptomyces sp. PCS3-D2]WKV74146.1 hypothetical protein AW27_023165 [Streptomyces sp. PCS3-D2]
MVVPQTDPMARAMIAGGVDYRPWDGQGLRDDECFLCTRPIPSGSGSVEDVIPRWLQRGMMPPGHPRPKIELPNLTPITADKVKIPACRPCNNEHLSRIENTVREAFAAGAEAVAALPEATMRIWLGKILYGLRRNDMRLRADRRDRNSPSLAETGDLEQAADLHLLLQEARGVVRTRPGHSTIMVFESQADGCNVCDFDLAVAIGWPYAVMIRMGAVTVMGAVADGGALGILNKAAAFAVTAELALHALQARALWALFVYHAAVLRQTSVPVRYAVGDGQVWVDRVPGGKPEFDHAGAPASPDLILQNLINTSADVLRAHGGPQGLLLLPDGSPRAMPSEHGVRKLGL